MPDENEVYLAVPYLNEDGLELYTKLILRKLVSLVVTTTSNVHDYEREYSANPAIEVSTLRSGIEPDTIWTLPLSYGVGTGQLRVTISGYMMYPGIDYEEVGEAGTASNQIKFLTSIEAGSILGVIVYPQQFSFGRNINVSSVVSPQLALSTKDTSLLQLDEDDKAILERSVIEGIAIEKTDACVHLTGDERVAGQKTFVNPIKVDISETDLYPTQTYPLLNASFKANGLQYNLQPITVVAGNDTDEAYSGALMIGSNTGCTWIGSGESFHALPTTFGNAGIDFANDESVIISSDAKITFYVGCEDEGSSFVKAAEFEADGTARFTGEVYGTSANVTDDSNRFATTHWVKQTAMAIDGDQEINGVKNFHTSPTVPTPVDTSNDGSVVNTEFVKSYSVLLMEDQTIPSQKTFTQNVLVSNSTPELELVSERALKGTNPANRIEAGIVVNDRVGNQLGSIKHRYEPSGESAVFLQAMDSRSSSIAFSTMGIAIDGFGETRTFAPTPHLGDSSSKIATTKFVTDTLVSYATGGLDGLISGNGLVYVSPEGDDESDGSSSESSVKSISKALEIALKGNNSYGVDAYILVTEGTYTGGLDIDGISCIMEVNGNVKVIENTSNKHGIHVKNGGSITVKGASNASTLTISRSAANGSGITASGSSHVQIECNTTIEAVECQFGIRIDNGSSIATQKPLTIDATDIVHHALSLEGGFGSFNDILKIMGEGLPTGLYASCSHVYFNAGINEAEAEIANGGINLVRNTACVIAYGTSTVQAKSRAVYLESSSTLQIANAIVTFNATESNECIKMTRSAVLFGTGNPTVTINAQSTYAILVEYASMCDIGTGTWTFNGLASAATIGAFNQSMVKIATGATLGGNIAGTRYSIATRSMIDVGSLGEERIPGSAAGMLNTAQQAMYI